MPNKPLKRKYSTHVSLLVVINYLLTVILLPAQSNNVYQVSSEEVAVLHQYFINLKSSLNFTTLDSQLWTQSWVSSFNQQWPSATNGNYATGKLLPPDIATFVTQTPVPYNQQTLASYLSNGATPLLSNQSEMDAFAGLIAVYADSLSNGISDAVPQLLGTRAAVVPPTKGDVVTFHTMNVLLLSTLPCNQITAAQMSEWISLATGTNPIYRLIAAQAFSQIIPSASWPAFYASYANESDPTIADVVINILLNSSLKSNITTLQQIEQGQQNVGNTIPANNAAQAIQKLQSYGH